MARCKGCGKRFVGMAKNYKGSGYHKGCHPDTVKCEAFGCNNVVTIEMRLQGRRFCQRHVRYETETGYREYGEWLKSRRQVIRR